MYERMSALLLIYMEGIGVPSPFSSSLPLLALNRSQIPKCTLPHSSQQPMRKQDDQTILFFSVVGQFPHMSHMMSVLVVTCPDCLTDAPTWSITQTKVL